MGVKGHKTKYVVIAKEIVNCREYHSNIIRFGMIESIAIQKRNALSPQVKRVLKKFVDRTPQRLEGKDGWIYMVNVQPMILAGSLKPNYSRFSTRVRNAS